MRPLTLRPDCTRPYRPLPLAARPTRRERDDSLGRVVLHEIRRLAGYVLFAAAVFAFIFWNEYARAESFGPADTLAAIETVNPAYRNQVRSIVACETGQTYDPSARGDNGTSWGAVQLSTLRTGLYGHFLSVGFTDADDPWQAIAYLERVAAGEWAGQGITTARWSCAR